IHGANYAQPEQTEPKHWIMAQTLADARRILANAKVNYSWRYDENGAGQRPESTPLYGEPGDGAVIYRVGREHPDFSEVLDEPGDRARHAFGFVDWDAPAYVATFGPRRGLTIERA